MSPLDRILLFLFSIVVLILSVFLGAKSLNYPWFDQLFDMYPMETLASTILLFLVSLRFIFFRTGASREPQSIVQKTENGDIKISIQTLESLAERATRFVRGVNDLKTKVRPSEVGIHIAIRISVDPDLEIPQITSSVQQKVKDYVESTAGVTVQNVTVYVNDIAKMQSGKVSTKPRVE